MPKPTNIIMSPTEFKNLKLLNRHSSVLIKVDQKNAERTTKSGIIITGDPDFDKAAHAERTGTVVWVPEELNQSELEWDTKLELEVGDKVWYDYMMGSNCIQFLVEDEVYKFLNYNNIYVAERGGEIIMLNGYCLFSLMDDENESEFAIETGKKDARLGVGKYMGGLDNNYRSKVWSDDPKIQEGVTAIFGMPPVLLEDVLHTEFENGNNLRLSQRKYVLGYYDNEGKVHPTKSHILIKPDKRRMVTDAGLIIPDRAKDDYMRYGTVLENKGMGELKAGDRVYFYLKAATVVDDIIDGEVALMKSHGITHKYS